nr:purine permease 3-like [Ipomoea batatas]
MVESLISKLKLEMEASEVGKGSMRMRRLFLFLNGTMMCIGSCGGPLLLRLYFIRGGGRIWFSTWISTAGWPITIIPLAAAYYTRRRATTTKTNFFTITRNITLAGAALGVLLGIINYLYTYGISKLPVSTSSLIVASQLAFTAGAAFVLVKQRFTAFTVNAVVLLTIGAGVLAVGSSGDRPVGESKKEYVAAFLMTFAAAALYGALLPCIELTYIKARQCLTYTLVLEFQMVMSLFATAVCTVGMLVNKDFQCFPAMKGAFFSQGEEQQAFVKEVCHDLKFLDGALNHNCCFGVAKIGFVDAALAWIVWWAQMIEEIVGVKLILDEDMPSLAKWYQNVLEAAPVLKECTPPREKLVEHFKGFRKMLAAASN